MLRINNSWLERRRWVKCWHKGGSKEEKWDLTNSGVLYTICKLIEWTISQQNFPHKLESWILDFSFQSTACDSAIICDYTIIYDGSHMSGVFHLGRFVAKSTLVFSHSTYRSCLITVTYYRAVDILWLIITSIRPRYPRPHYRYLSVFLTVRPRCLSSRTRGFCCQNHSVLFAFGKGTLIFRGIICYCHPWKSPGLFTSPFVFGAPADWSYYC